MNSFNDGYSISTSSSSKTSIEHYIVNSVSTGSSPFVNRPFMLIIAGGRDFDDYDLLERTADKLLANKVAQGFRIIIVCGKAKGADTLGEKYARNRGYSVAEYPADWSTGKGAGYKRNAQMAMYALSYGIECGGCLCFWNEISKGTKHMIDIANSKSLPLRIVKYKTVIDNNQIKRSGL